MPKATVTVGQKGKPQQTLIKKTNPYAINLSLIAKVTKMDIPMLKNKERKTNPCLLKTI